MKYANFNNLGLSDEQVDAIKDCISNHIASGMATIDDYNTQFVVYERMVGTESRGLLLKVKTTAARFHFFANLWRQPSENGRLKLKAYLEDSNAGSWRFEQQGIKLSVKNKRGHHTRGNVFYFVPSGKCHCGNFSATDVYEKREALGALAKSILDKLNEVNYFTVDYSSCRLADEGEDGVAIPDDEPCGSTESCRPNKSCQMILENGGSEPAMIQVDMKKWQQSEYSAEVKELSALGPGVLSWVSTVEDVAKRSAVNVKGVLVKPAKLCIPPYQRKFAWKEQNVRQLCKDLLKAGNKANYHLGTVILHHECKNGEELWNVVDGQQRLTNIMAILEAPVLDLPVKQFLTRDYLMISQVVSDYSAEERLKIRERLAKCTLAFISVEDVSEAFQLFTTQNGRGKPLTPVNLLKAYHYKAMEAERLRMSQDEFNWLLQRVECEWESANVTSIATAPGDGKLLLHVFREYLFRLRQWSRGKFPQVPFDAGNIGEFKGVTIRDGVNGLPLQNGAVLRTDAPVCESFVAHRYADDEMDPYATIIQTIVNGSDFFRYAQSYVAAYKHVFIDGKVHEFADFYLKNCNPRHHKSGAAMYARHVFEALCMFCYDRFGAKGLKACCRSLFACAYFERISQTRVLYRRCGASYAPTAVELMMTNYSVEDVQEALNELRSSIRLKLNSSDYLKELLKKASPTRGERMQRSAFETIMK